MRNILLLILFIYLGIKIPLVVLFMLVVFWVTWCGYKLYLYVYFKSNTFSARRAELKSHIDDCNALNIHIAELKRTYSDSDAGGSTNGYSTMSDRSVYTYKRPAWEKNINSRWTHNCSATVAKNANNQPFKYICKYFDIPATENTLTQLENVLNCFAAAEQGKSLLLEHRKLVLDDAYRQIPWLIKKISPDRISSELGFQPVDLSDLYFPVYSFIYVSAGGQSSYSCDIKLDLKNLELFVGYIDRLVKLKNSVAGQRALMTVRLREEIKNRDFHTCQKCGLSTAAEPHLLLEIDHIIPLSRGGGSDVSNLQTLCWRCNRAKGSKLC